MSDDSLLVVLEFHNKRLDVFTLGFPLCHALFGVRVEVLFLLVLQRLVSKSHVLLLDELFLEFTVLVFSLFFEVVGELDPSLPFFLPLLLLSDGELIISEFPEL